MHLPVLVHQLAAELAGEAEHVVRAQEQLQLLAVLHHLQQLVGRLRRIRNHALVVVQRHGLGRLRHAVQLAVHLHAVHAGLRNRIQLAGQLVIQRHHHVRPHPVAQVVVRRHEHVRPAAGRHFGLVLVENLIERDLQHVDLGIRIRRLGVLDQLGQGRFLGAAGLVRIPQRHFARHRGQRDGSRRRRSRRGLAGRRVHGRAGSLDGIRRGRGALEQPWSTHRRTASRTGRTPRSAAAGSRRPKPRRTRPPAGQPPSRPSGSAHGPPCQCRSAPNLCPSGTAPGPRQPAGSGCWG